MVHDQTAFVFFHISGYCVPLFALGLLLEIQRPFWLRAIYRVRDIVRSSSIMIMFLLRPLFFSRTKCHESIHIRSMVRITRLQFLKRVP